MKTKHFLDVTKVIGVSGLSTYVVTLDGRVVDEFLTQTEAGEKVQQLIKSFRG